MIERVNSRGSSRMVSGTVDSNRGPRRRTPYPRSRPRTKRAPRTPAASSASGRRASRSPSSPTSASTRCSTAARKPPASRSATAARCSSTRTSAWSRQVFDEATLATLQGHLAVGHTRYSTTGSTTWENAQPSFRTTPAGTGLALGHNGNLVNTVELFAEARAGGILRQNALGATTDSDLLTALLAARPDVSVEQAAMEVLPKLRGAFSLVFMDEHTLYAARDPQGVRPLVLGRLERGWVVTSETAALDIVGASFVREIEPGELIAIDEDGLRSQHFANAEPKGCLFEYVYLARPDTTIAGRNVHSARVEVGRRLAKEHPAEADLVIPVPESGTPAAIGYAEASGIPYGARAGQELLRRTDVHPAVADDPPARHPAQAQPAARRHPRQAAGRGRRLDRARQHPARAGADAARGRRGRGARAHLVAAGEVAVLLRHRLRVQGRADRQRPRRSTASGTRSAPTRSATSRSTAWSRRASSRAAGCAWPASTGTTRSSCPTSSASTCSRASSGASDKVEHAAGYAAEDALSQAVIAA